MATSQSRQEQMAYFRFGVLSPLLAQDPEKTRKEMIEAQAACCWTLPDGRVKRFSFGTIENWLYAYERFGLEGLLTGDRSDTGTFRGVDDELANKLDAVLTAHPKLRTHALLDHLRKAGELDASGPSVSTLYRYLKSRRSTLVKAAAPADLQKERLAFEAPYAGYLWQADLMYGPHLPMRLPNGRTRQAPTYLIGIIDDHSRLFCHGEFFFRQDLPVWLAVLEESFRKRGIPKKLYCDNGTIFTAQQIKEIAARLGMEVRHTQVRDAAAKGKIERLFQRCRRSFLEPLLELNPPKTLAALNEALFTWIEEGYNHVRHDAFGDTPIRRFMESSSHMRVLGDDPTLFHTRDERRVKKDGTFSLNGERYEAAPGLVGCKVVVSYDLRRPQEVFVSWEGKAFGKAGLLDAKANCHRRRRSCKHQEGTDHA